MKVNAETGRRRCSVHPICSATSSEPRLLRGYGMLCTRCYGLVPRTNKARRRELTRRCRFYGQRLQWMLGRRKSPPQSFPGVVEYASVKACRRALIALSCDETAYWVQMVRHARQLRMMGVRREDADLFGTIWRG